MTYERLREILFFFRANLLALLAVTLPFAAAGTLITQVFGEPVQFEADSPGSVHWQSALTLLALYPLALGVKTVAIHRLAGNEPLTAGALLGEGLRLWPTMAALSLLTGLFIGSAAMLGLGVGMEILQGAGLVPGAGAGLLFLFALPALWLYVRVGCAGIIAAAEGLGALDALGAAWRRSRALQGMMFPTLLAVLGALLLLLVLLFALLGAGGPEATVSAGADLLARSVSEWLFCLLTIAFYRFWSLLPRDA